MNRITHEQSGTTVPGLCHPRRGGAVIIVVLALMAMLAFLGLFFYDFVQVEANTAENFARTTGELEGIDPESIINEAISQIISHTDEEAADRGSVLDGGKLSLLAHELGTMIDDGSGNFKPRDYEFRNGRGLSVDRNDAMTPFKYAGPNSDPTVNSKSAADFILNRSRAANGATAIDPTFDYEPDVGYTYPDLNGVFLSYDYLPSDAAAAVRVIKPSFMDLDVFLNLLEPNTDQWYTDSATSKWMLRPHTAHEIPTAAGTPRFLTAFPKLTATELNLGPWTGDVSDYSGLDADADNDGFFDSIYLDLGLSPVTLDDGNRTLVPISFWKIEDLSGLIDLNAAGNPADLLAKNRTSSVVLQNEVFNATRSVHWSNYGASRAEVNPAWGLFSDPTSANAAQLVWNKAFYRNTTGTMTFDLRKLQNTELAMLLLGSTTTMGHPLRNLNLNDRLDDMPGRFGETNLIPTADTGPFSAPGTMGTDEDHSTNTAISEDVDEDGVLDPGEDLNNNGILDDPRLPHGVHPSDLAGLGSTQIDTGTGVRQLGGASGPLRFPTYQGTWQTQPLPGGTTPTFRTNTTYQTLQPTLLQAAFDLRKDDPAEVNRYSFSNVERDNLFRPYEIASLHLGDYDFTRSSLFSRVRQLAPFNFNMTAYSRDVRRQYTTESWGRREFVFPYTPGARSFEFNDDDGQGFRFPPKFGMIASRHEVGAPLENTDPFRPVVRRLLTTRIYPSGTAQPRDRIKFPQLPLELNRILDDQGGAPAFDELGNPNFRALTPHPVDEDFDDDGTLDGNEDLNQNSALDVFTGPVPAMVYGNTDPVAVPYAARFASMQNQEWWARYDRQRMAQDIFVLLASLCSTVDPTVSPLPLGEDTNGNGKLDSGEDANTNGLLDSPAREMAQFAVNLVDAMDPDDVITRFAYDTDLATGGWNPSGAVYVDGVEAQKVSIGEVLWLKQTMSSTSSDNAETYHKDDDGHHQFLYVELRNCTPLPVSLQKDTWRLVRLDPTKSAPEFDAWDATNHLASVEFESTTKGIAPGTNFVVSTHDGRLRLEANAATVLGSDLYANTEVDPATLEVVVPTTSSYPNISAGMNPPPDPQCDLDLCHPNHSSEFQLTSTFPDGKLLLFLDNTNAIPDPETRMVLSLQRRRHLEGNGNLAQDPNDWIEVDRFDFDNHAENTFQLNMPAQILAELPDTRSKERYHHLVGRSDATGMADAMVPATDRVNLSNHSLDRPNNDRVNTISDPAAPNAGTDMTAAYASLWQPHHDRDFTSAYELMTVPLCGPHAVLQLLHDRTHTLAQGGGITGWGDSAANLPFMASARFLPRPTDTTSIPWTRLLNFVALPDPTDHVQRNINPAFVRSRTYGRVNVNMIRSPKVLAGLLDEDLLVDMNSWTLQDKINPSRHWWTDFKNLRDGSGAVGPGALNSRPFQDPGGFYSGTEGPGYAVEHGLLRHPYSAYPPTSVPPEIGLLEARAQVDATTNYVDVHTRHRLLRKLANNATTRSHMFAIWGGIDFFEGTTSGAGFQVGAKAADVQTCRWFFVVDMSRLEDAYDPASQTFDWRAFIVYRQRLE